eukprot:gene1453-biopygen3644
MEFAQSIERYMCTWILQLLLRAFLHLLSLSNWVAVEVEVIFGGELAYLIADDFAAFQSRKLLQRQPIQTELPIDLAREHTSGEFGICSPFCLEKSMLRRLVLRKVDRIDGGFENSKKRADVSVVDEF